jgi:hypothetical protein
MLGNPAECRNPVADRRSFNEQRLEMRPFLGQRNRSLSVIPAERSESRDPCHHSAALNHRMLEWTAPDGIDVPE